MENLKDTLRDVFLALMGFIFGVFATISGTKEREARMKHEISVLQQENLRLSRAIEEIRK